MNDPTNEPEPDVDASFDDPALDDIRGLLRDARATEPVPAEVVARLDATLRSLRAEVDAPPATVVPLRRRLGPLLAAAAAVLVVAGGGLGVAQLAGNRSQDTADSTAGRTTGADAGRTPLGPTGPEAASRPTARGQQDGLLSLAVMPTFTTAGFARQAARFAASAVAAEGLATSTDKSFDSAGEAASPAPEAAAPGSTPTLPASDCTAPALPGVEAVAIVLDGKNAVLVLHPVRDGAQIVEAWSCDGRTLLTTATVTR